MGGWDIFAFCFTSNQLDYGAHCAPLQTVAFQMVRRKRILVEMRRVELLSENRLQKPSTSVAILLKFPLRRAKWRAQRFSSLLIMTENEAVSGSRSPLRLRPYPSRGTHG